MARILYILVFIFLLMIACPIVYAILQIILVLFGDTYDSLTGSDDFFMWWFS